MSIQYPDNIVPQYRSPQPVGEYDIDLKCKPDNSLQSLIIQDSNLVVIKGWDTKATFELESFFMPCNGFSEIEILLPNLNDDTTQYHEAYHGDDDFITLNYGLLQNIEGKVPFVAIFPLYHHTKENDQTQWKINMRFQGETEWKELGRLFIWSSTKDNGILPIELQNNMSKDVYLKVLIAN